MKLKTVLVAATAAGIGYVFGTKAGRDRFEQIRGQAKDFLGSPQVQDTVANLSETAKQNAHKLPDPVAGVVNAVADKVKDSTTAASTTPEPPFDDFPTAPASSFDDFPTAPASSFDDPMTPASSFDDPTPTTPATPPQ